MIYIEAPHKFVGNGPAVFLAGGISDCENWQCQVAKALQHVAATVLNPRRASFSQHTAAENQRQIEWEHRHLRRADLVAFWFPPQTLCPIALFELGVCCASGKQMIVGADPHYARRFDLEPPIVLHRPHAKIAGTLAELLDQIQNHSMAKRVPS